MIENKGLWLPLEIYKAVRPYIEEVAEREARPISYEELFDHLFDVIGGKRMLTRAQIGGHIGRSKKLTRFKVGRVIYVVSIKAYDKFMRGEI